MHTCEIYYDARQSFTGNNISLSLLSWKCTKISCLMAGVAVDLLLNIVFLKCKKKIETKHGPKQRSHKGGSYNMIISNNKN